MGQWFHMMVVWVLAMLPSIPPASGHVHIDSGHYPSFLIIVLPLACLSLPCCPISASFPFLYHSKGVHMINVLSFTCHMYGLMGLEAQGATHLS